jgi:hypothetical protein
MTERKLPPVNRPSLGERLSVRAVVAIVAALVVVIGAGAVLVRGTQAPAPTPASTLAATQASTSEMSGSAVAAASASPTQPANDYIDPETVTRAFIAAVMRTKAHPQDLSDVTPYLLPASFAVDFTRAYFDQKYVKYKQAFTVSAQTISSCTVAVGPLWTYVPGGVTPRPDLPVAHVVCQGTYTGQETDLAGKPVGTHDPVWSLTFKAEVQQFNGLWYIDDWTSQYV